MSSSLGETQLSKVENFVNKSINDSVIKLFTCNGKEKDGEKLLSVIVDYREDIINHKIPNNYLEVTEERLCDYLENKHSELSFIDLKDEIIRECIYFLFYIWIHNTVFLSKLNFQQVSKSDNVDDGGAYLLYTLMSAFNQFKNNELDGRNIETIGKDEEAVEGGGPEIKLTMYLFLLLIMFVSITAPNDSKTMDDATYPALNKHLSSLVQKGSEVGNNVVDQFLTVVGVAQKFNAVQYTTLFSLKAYKNSGLNNLLEHRTGITLLSLLNHGLYTEKVLTKAKNRFVEISLKKQNQIGSYIAKVIHTDEDFTQEAVRNTFSLGSNFMKAGIINKTRQIGAKMFRNQLKGSAYGVLLGTMLVNIDKIVDILQENKFSMQCGSSMLSVLGGIKNAKNKSLNYIKDKIGQRKTNLHKFNLTIEDMNDVELFLQDNESTDSELDVFMKLLETNALLGGRKFQTRKKKLKKKRRSIRRH